MKQHAVPDCRSGHGADCGGPPDCASGARPADADGWMGRPRPIRYDARCCATTPGTTLVLECGGGGRTCSRDGHGRRHEAGTNRRTWIFHARPLFRRAVGGCSPDEHVGLERMITHFRERGNRVRRGARASRAPARTLVVGTAARNDSCENAHIAAASVISGSDHGNPTKLEARGSERPLLSNKL